MQQHHTERELAPLLQQPFTRRCESREGDAMKVCGATAAVPRTSGETLTLSDVLGVAENVSTTHAAEIVRALLASGRIRFVNPDIQRDLNVLSHQLA